MKNPSVAKSNTAEGTSSRCSTEKVAGHEHIHASNCGHKSYVHGDHIDYFHDGHFHYMHDGHVHPCEGPTPAAVLPFKKK